MIISYRKQFIFIHCRKTAGSSISMLLSEQLGPADIQLSALSEILDAGGNITNRTSWGAARNVHRALPALFSGKRRWPDTFAVSAKKAYQRQLGHKPQHSSAANIAKAFPDEWNTFIKFCVVRNPFCLAVSDYKWRTRHLKNPPHFIDYLKALKIGNHLGGLVPVGFHDNWRQYTIEERIVVDKVIRYENLTEELSNFLPAIGIPFSGGLPKLKARTGGTEYRTPYSIYYTPEAVELVSELYKKEIYAFGYKFEDIDQ